MRLQVKRLDPRATLPARAHDDDAGFDLCALDGITLKPGERALVATGIAIALPAGTVGLVVPRSGLAAKHGLTLVNSPGIIDAGYRGEIRCILLNTDATEPIEINAGDRIAQLVVQRVEAPAVLEVEELPPTMRGGGGFGSTGR